MFIPDVISKKEMNVGIKNRLSDNISLIGIVKTVVNIIVDKIFNNITGSLLISVVKLILVDTVLLFVLMGLFKRFIRKEERSCPKSRGMLIVFSKTNKMKNKEIKELNLRSRLASWLEIKFSSNVLVIK